MTNFVGGVLFVIAFLAALAGALILGSAKSAIHEIEAGVCFIVGAILLVASILCSIAVRLRKIQEAMIVAARESEIANKSRDGVATERWDILCASLDKLDGSARTTKPQHSSVGAAFDPPPDDDPTTHDRPSPTSVSPELKVKCWKCGKTVKAKAEWAGRRGKCPGCGSPIQFIDASAASGEF